MSAVEFQVVCPQELVSFCQPARRNYVTSIAPLIDASSLIFFVPTLAFKFLVFPEPVLVCWDPVGRLWRLHAMSCFIRPFLAALEEFQVRDQDHVLNIVNRPRKRVAQFSRLCIPRVGILPPQRRVAELPEQIIASGAQRLAQLLLCDEIDFDHRTLWSSTGKSASCSALSS
jgi:hypothetical protein